MENELQKTTNSTLKAIEKYERNWHLAKAFIYIIVGIAIIIVNIYTYNHIVQNNNNNKQLLKCALISFTPANHTETITQFDQSIRNCVNRY